jgi:hypothetical protein
VLVILEDKDIMVVGFGLGSRAINPMNKNPNIPLHLLLHLLLLLCPHNSRLFRVVSADVADIDAVLLGVLDAKDINLNSV